MSGEGTSVTTITTTNVVLVSVIALLAIAGNVSIVFVYFKNYKRRTVTNTMFLNMCVIDLFSALSDIAFYIVAGLLPSLKASYAFCRASLFFDHLLKIATVLCMTGVAVERYFSLARLTHRRLTRVNAGLVILWVWAQATTAFMPWDLLDDQPRAEDEILQICGSIPRVFAPGLQIESMNFALAVLCIYLPFAAFV
ncbi:predicted protein, partial [Nematostella vectensis]